MRRKYVAPNGVINKSTLMTAIAGLSNLIVVGKTSSGYVVGGYTGSATIPTTSTSKWLSASNSFIFSLTTDIKYSTAYSSLNIWVNRVSSSLDLIDFGYHNALQFEARSGLNGQVYYTTNADFKSPPSVSEFTYYSGYNSLSNFEVWQMTYQ